MLSLEEILACQGDFLQATWKIEGSHSSLKGKSLMKAISNFEGSRKTSFSLLVEGVPSLQAKIE